MADLNALIAQGAQFRIPPPVDPMGNMPQLMQMRASQNQNALAQYQLSSAQREDASTNALNTAYQNAYDPATGKIDSARLLQSLASSGAGSQIPKVQKSLTDAEIARLQREELQGKVNALPGAAAHTAAQTAKITSETKRDELKRAISDISNFNNAADALQNLAIHERDGKISPEKAAQMRAVLSDPNLSFSKWQRSTVMGLMDEKDRVEATRPKPVATQLGDRVVYQDMNPDSPTFKQEILPEQKMGATPSTAAASEQARAATSNAATAAARLKWEQANPGFSVHMTDQGPVAVNNKDPSKVTQITLDGQPLGKPLANIPATANKAMISNEQNLSLAKTALALAEGKTVGEVKGDIAATGWKGVLSDEMLQRIDPEGVNTRAYIADLGSMIVHDRSGAAVTASEMPRLKPFIPKSTDTAEAVQDKLKRFIRAFEQENNLYNEAYSKEQGYRPRSNANQPNVSPTVDELVKKYTKP
jgi:hypothetical protein